MIDRRSWRLGFWEGVIAVALITLAEDLLDPVWWLGLLVAAAYGVIVGRIFRIVNARLEERWSS